MTPARLVKALSELSFQDTFNPYSGRCALSDRAEAPLLRLRLLRAMLKAAVETEVDVIWIGRDFGWRGGRRTGLAFTDDVHLAAHAGRWGIPVETRPTRGIQVTEGSAAAIWRVLPETGTNIFLWNVFPLHPHEPDKPFTNRPHTARERRVGEEILDQIIHLLRPRLLVGIGNDAAASARRLAGRRAVVQVRHPSHGGRKQFVEQISHLTPGTMR